MPEFKSSADVNAYIQKQATLVKDVLGKVDAAANELKTTKAKFSGNNLAKGYSEESVAKFEQARKSVLATIGYCERYLADVKEMGADVLRAFVR